MAYILNHELSLLYCCVILKLLVTLSQEEETMVLPLVKQENVERDDCNLDLKVEVNISAECGLTTGEYIFVDL